MNKAIFFDRDGVINQLVVDPITKEAESPHSVEDLVVLPGAIESLKKVSSAGYILFIVSNQPSFAKGKTSLENLYAIHDKLHKIFIENNITFAEYYYCYHHPQGIIPEYSIKCDCRKPGQKNILDAKAKYKIDMDKSWFVGDQDMDIECGKVAGLKTVLIENELSALKRGKIKPDFVVKNIVEAVDLIIDEDNKV